MDQEQLPTEVGVPPWLQRSRVVVSAAPKLQMLSGSSGRVVAGAVVEGPGQGPGSGAATASAMAMAERQVDVAPGWALDLQVASTTMAEALLSTAARAVGHLGTDPRVDLAPRSAAA